MLEVKATVCWRRQVPLTVAGRCERRNWKWNNNRTKSGVTNKIPWNTDITNRTPERGLNKDKNL